MWHALERMLLGHSERFILNYLVGFLCFAILEYTISYSCEFHRFSVNLVNFMHNTQIKRYFFSSWSCAVQWKLKKVHFSIYFRNNISKTMKKKVIWAISDLIHMFMCLFRTYYTGSFVNACARATTTARSILFWLFFFFFVNEKCVEKFEKAVVNLSTNVLYNVNVFFFHLVFQFIHFSIKTDIFLIFY